MRYFRRLPLLLRVASILGLLFSLVPIVVFIEVLIAGRLSVPQWGEDTSRVEIIAWNLGLLGCACTLSVDIYSTRFRRPDRRPFPLDSWRSQARAISLLAALPIGALVLAVIIPTSLALQVIFPVSIIGSVVLLIATSFWMHVGRTAVN